MSCAAGCRDSQLPPLPGTSQGGLQAGKGCTGYVTLYRRIVASWHRQGYRATEDGKEDPLASRIRLLQLFQLFSSPTRSTRNLLSPK